MLRLIFPDRDMGSTNHQPKSHENKHTCRVIYPRLEEQDKQINQVLIRRIYPRPSPVVKVVLLTALVPVLPSVSTIQAGGLIAGKREKEKAAKVPSIGSFCLIDPSEQDFPVSNSTPHVQGPISQPTPLDTPHIAHTHARGVVQQIVQTPYIAAYRSPQHARHTTSPPYRVLAAGHRMAR